MLAEAGVVLKLIRKSKCTRSVSEEGQKKNYWSKASKRSKDAMLILESIQSNDQFTDLYWFDGKESLFRLDKIDLVPKNSLSG